ncbi:MAG TPA: hypothetical protein EYP39_05545 [Ghiorsea sp.]|nr:hypothetical protein [Ghiorsea sp.]HIP07265.1 hypothetical protein [Mariprofundaceae bacterium]
MKTLKVLMIACGLLFVPMQQASAGDYEVQNVMDDAMYGAGVGALVGLGLMLLTDKPTDNWNYVSRGLGVGIIAGAAYGMYRSKGAFAQIEDGQINLGMPSPEIAFRDTPSGLDMIVTTNLIGGRF